jgi:hypothetical protein
MGVGLGGRAPLIGNLKALYNMSRKALDTENLSSYCGFMRGTWGEGSYADDSEGHETEGSGTGSLLLWGSIRGI